MAIAGGAQAGSLLDSSMYGAIAGTQNVTVNGVTFSSAPGDFVVKNLHGFSGLGVTGGRPGDETDIGETVTMSFAAQVVSDFSVAFLYNGPEFGDWREIAQVTAYNGAAILGIYTLTVGNDGAIPGATWSGAGSPSATCRFPPTQAVLPGAFSAILSETPPSPDCSSLHLPAVSASRRATTSPTTR